MAANIPVLPGTIIQDFDYGGTRRFAEGMMSQVFSLALDSYNTVKAGISTLNGLDIVPVDFNGAVFDFTRPALPTLPAFPAAPSYSPPTPPTLIDPVGLDYIDGLENGIESFVDGRIVDAQLARALSALDATMLAEQQQAGDLWAAAGWTAPAGAQALLVQAATEKAAAGRRAAVRDIYVESREKALRIGLEAVRAKNDSVGAWNSAQTQMFASQVEVLRAGYTAYESAVRGISVAYDAESRIWSSGVNVDLEKAKFNATYALEAIKAQIEQNERLTGLAFEAARAATAVGAQVTAGALSASNVGMSYSEGQTVGINIGNNSNVSADLTPAKGSQE